MNFENETEEQVEQFVAKNLCEQDHLFFTRYFFRKRQNMRFLTNWHHEVISRAIERIFTGETEILVVNVPPGSSKTELVVINLIGRGLARNPHARFLHLSYSDDLALLNSATARDLVMSDEFQFFWPRQIADDAKSKKRWNIMVDGKTAGGVYATSLGGQITGFRAGHMVEGFQGAIIIDDPLKPEDAYSKSKVDAANRKLLTTVKSRKARSTTPIILIMQRLAENDCSDFILKGALGKRKLEHIKIPAMVDDEYMEQQVPAGIRPDTSTLETDEKGRFSYWPDKEPLADLLALERGEGVDSEGARISRHVYAGQYGQDPVALGGNLIRGAYFPRYKVLPQMRYRKIYADTASKIKKRNDYSVFEEWGLGRDNRLYLIDMIRGKWEAPELRNQAIAFWAKVKARDGEKFGVVRGMAVEDKSSGTDLIQTLKAPPHSMPMKDIQRAIDKLERCHDALPYIEAGLVVLPVDAPFTSDFVAECEAFTADDSHAYDDQLDPMFDAIKDNLASGNKLKQWAKLGTRSVA